MTLEQFMWQSFVKTRMQNLIAVQFRYEAWLRWKRRQPPSRIEGRWCSTRQ